MVLMLFDCFWGMGKGKGREKKKEEMGRGWGICLGVSQREELRYLYFFRFK